MLELDFILKDLVLWLDYAIFFAIFVFLAPNMLGHPDNSIEANPLVTPAHIVPEWYFLAIYAILRSIPNKLAGVITVLLVFVTLFAVPFVQLASGVSASQFQVVEVAGTTGCLVRTAVYSDWACWVDGPASIAGFT